MLSTLLHLFTIRLEEENTKESGIKRKVQTVTLNSRSRVRNEVKSRIMRLQGLKYYKFYIRLICFIGDAETVLDYWQFDLFCSH